MKFYRKLKYRRLIPLVLAVAVLIVGASFAWSRQEVSVDNELKAHVTDVEITEKFDPRDSTGTVEEKEVKFTNTGNSSVFLRMTYTEYWEQEDGTILPNMVSNYGEPTEIAAKKVGTIPEEDPWEEGTDWKAPNTNLSVQWEQKDDGWYYYKGVLKPGESTQSIMDYVAIWWYVHLGRFDEYLSGNGTEYHLYFQVEAVQASDSAGTLNSAQVNADATWTTWHMTATVGDDGTVTWSEQAPAQGNQEGGDGV